MRNIAMIVGSLRKDSFTRKVAIAAAGLAPKELQCNFVEIGSLPLYNQDLDENPPIEWSIFKAHVKAADAVLFFTPEHNRSIPAALKNVLDVGSRPYGDNVWSGKPAAVVSVSPGGLGGFGANHHLRQVICFLNMPCMAQPEAYISGVDKLLEGEGLNKSSSEFLQKFMHAYAAWVELIKA